MPRDLGSNNEGQAPDDWARVDSEFRDRAETYRKWDAERDVGADFERSARPLAPDYGSERPRHREIPPEVAAEFGRTPEELQRLRERDPRGAGRHARQMSDEGGLDVRPSQRPADRPTQPHVGEPRPSERASEPRADPSAETRPSEPRAEGRDGERAWRDATATSREGPSTPHDGPATPREGPTTSRETARHARDVPAVERSEWTVDAPRHARESPIPRTPTRDATRDAGTRASDAPHTAQRDDPGRRPPTDLAEQPARAERAYPPTWLTSADRPPPIEQTRTYNRVGHLDRPLSSEQESLEEAVPRDERGNPECFPDPRGDWSFEVNGVGPILEPGRGSNCMDVTLSAISTWHGEPRVSAPRHEEYDANGDLVRTGERDGPKRAERWLGHSFENVGADAGTAFGEIERRLTEAGNGASAAIVNGWAPGGAHAWNAFNYQGKVYWVDAQMGDVSERPLYPQAIDVRAILMDGEGNKA